MTYFEILLDILFTNLMELKWIFCKNSDISAKW